MLSLLGLTDDYVSDGRVLTEIVKRHALPGSLEAHTAAFERLANAYKAINASVGPLGLASLRLSTAALASGDPTNDTRYQNAVSFLAGVADARDKLAQQIIGALDAAEFHGVPLDEHQAFEWAVEADLLVATVEAAAAAF